MRHLHFGTFVLFGDMANNRDYLTPKQVAERLNVTTRTLTRWREQDPYDGPPFVGLTPKTVRYPQTEFERWLTQNTIGVHNGTVQKD